MILFAVLGTFMGLQTTMAFGFGPSTIAYYRKSSQLSNQLSENDDIQTKEAHLEQLSRLGSDKISKMSISERAKRAMLAEAIEDNIFSKEIQLDELMGESGTIPTDPELLQQCRDISIQIKEAQMQYEALVSGEQSALLNSLESLGIDND
jgi:hypothetical protein